MNNERITDDKDFSVLDAMVEDYLSGPAIYHPSEYWKLINEKNTEWLRKDGMENFKRSVNNNYFNWMMICYKDDYFRALLRQYVRSLTVNPFRIKLLFSGHIGEMNYRTLVSETCRPGIMAKNVYRFYLMMFHDYVRRNDQFGLFETLEEPEIGNPIVCHVGNRKISQDLCNSYLEYAYLRQSLGDDFTNIHSVAEIGAGYGRLMYLFRCLHPEKKVVIVDIPPALFISQWYFRKLFPDTAIMEYRKFGEFSEVRETFERSRVCFLLPHQFELLADKCIDLIINVSSLHEMKSRQINRYYDLIDRKAAFFFTKQWLFWENIWDKQVMPAVVYPTKPHWELIAARLNPIHRSFFEALFRL